MTTPTTAGTAPRNRTRTRLLPCAPATGAARDDPAHRHGVGGRGPDRLGERASGYLRNAGRVQHASVLACSLGWLVVLGAVGGEPGRDGVGDGLANFDIESGAAGLERSAQWCGQVGGEVHPGVGITGVVACWRASVLACWPGV